jgi:hypothetical protein
MKTISAMALFFLLNASSNALDLKLQCNITSEETYSYSTDKIKTHGSTEIEIHDFGVDKDISATSALISIDSKFVSTRKFATKEIEVISVADLSNANKWDISNEFQNIKNGNSHNVHMVVDRNSGNLIISDEATFSNGDLMTIEASGNCKKIDTKIKKF